VAQTVRMVDLIRDKRAGERLDRDDLAFIVRGATDGSIPDYQLSAWLMAVCWQGMTDAETADLTLAVAGSGVQLDYDCVLGSSGGVTVVDKHSTGGVGDKATLVVAPIVAACGVPIAKLTGRGLGHTGGTVDKLESITGMRLALGRMEFLDLLARWGCVIAGQSAELAPADGLLYALRDATSTVESIPLIASSIMSKKLAGGAGAILLDVKVGSGAFMKDRRAAQRLAELMVSIGERAGRRMQATLSNMEQPLGNAVGNAVEVAEAIQALQGAGPADLDILCRHEAVALLLLAGRVQSQQEAVTLVDRAIASGAALERFADVVEAQGGDRSQVLNPTRLPSAPVKHTLNSPAAGWIARLDALTVGLASVRLGAGRAAKHDAIRHDAGIVLQHKAGDRVERGEPLLEVHASSDAAATTALAELLPAYTIVDHPVAPLPVLLSAEGTAPA